MNRNVEETKLEFNLDATLRSEEWCKRILERSIYIPLLDGESDD